MGTHEHDPEPPQVIGLIHIQWLQDQASLAQENMWPVHVTALAVQLNQGYVVHMFPKVKLMCISWKKSPT